MEISKLIKRVNDFDKTTCVWLKYKNETKPRIYKWIGTNTIVVQVGDQIDRCRPLNNECTNPNETINDEASDLTIMFFFHDLHLIAIKTLGCAVYSLLGNHELLNVLGNLRYVSYKGLNEFNTNLTIQTDNLMEGRAKAFEINSSELYYKSKSNIANFMACSRVSSIVVDKYLFVHAGILEKLINYTTKEKNISKSQSIGMINNTIRNWLLNLDTIEDKEYINKLLGGKNFSPFWPRIFGNLPSDLDNTNKLCTNHVNPILKHLDLKGIVVGHTPQLKMGINSTCSSSVWRIDVAGSQAFDKIMETDLEIDKSKIKSIRQPQVLEIILGSDQIKDTFNIIKMSN